jgi:hypothetical protein
MSSTAGASQPSVGLGCAYGANEQSRVRFYSLEVLLLPAR